MKNLRKLTEYISTILFQNGISEDDVTLEICESLLDNSQNLYQLIKDSIGERINEKELVLISDTTLYTLVHLVIDREGIEVISDNSNFDYDDNYSTGNLFASNMYKNDVSKYHLLTPQEEVDLFIRYRNGDKSARDILINSNQRLVMSIAKFYIDEEYDFMSAVQDGNIGLMKAIDTFDVDRGYKLSTYATWWIKQNIQREKMNTAKSIRVPVHMNERLSKYFKIRKMYYDTHLVEASDEYLMKELRIGKEQLELLKSIPSTPLSLNSFIKHEEEDTEFGDVISDQNAVSPEEYAIQSALKNDILEMLDKLPKKLKVIIALRHGIAFKEKLSFLELADIFRISKYNYRDRCEYYENFDFLNRDIRESDEGVKEFFSTYKSSVEKMQPFVEKNLKLEYELRKTQHKEEYIEAVISDNLERVASAILTDREFLIYALRNGLNIEKLCTLEDVGRAFNLTRERVRQLEAKAMRTIRNPKYTRKLESYRNI